MTCYHPPELDDTQLLAYLQGEADSEVAVHLEQCSHCREKAHRLALIHDGLTRRLYRVTCPTPSELGEYHMGLLPPDREAAVAAHLHECHHCAHEVAQLTAYLAELAPDLEPSLLEQAKARTRVLIARLVGGGASGGPSRQPALAPAFAGLRGPGEGACLYEAGDFQISVGIQADTRADRMTILGLLLGTDETLGWQAHLWRADKFVTTGPIDEYGNFAASDLAPGIYELILGGSDAEIHIQHLEVRGQDAPCHVEDQ